MAAKKKLVTIDVVALGRAGGNRRAAVLGASQRREIAKAAAAKRWAAYYEAHPEKLRAKQQKQNRTA